MSRTMLLAAFAAFALCVDIRAQTTASAALPLDNLASSISTSSCRIPRHRRGSTRASSRRRCISSRCATRTAVVYQWESRKRCPSPLF
jgi:hypothetical protein